MSNNFEYWLLILILFSCSESKIPNVDQAIVRAAWEDIRVETMPAYILDRRIVVENLENR
jgi:hypothetical protein